MKRLSIVVAAVLGLAGLGAAAVGVVRTASGETRGGPLRVDGGAQGFAMTAPATTPYDATFGSILLCTEADEGITIDRVTTVARLAPRRVSVWIRRGSEVPTAAALGSPPDLGAGFERLRPGALVSVPCGPRSQAVPLGVELFVTLEAGRSGARVGPTSIHYTAGTRHYVRVVDYDMVACGTSPKVRGLCR